MKPAARGLVLIWMPDAERFDEIGGGQAGTEASRVARRMDRRSSGRGSGSASVGMGCFLGDHHVAPNTT